VSCADILQLSSAKRPIAQVVHKYSNEIDEAAHEYGDDVDKKIASETADVRDVLDRKASDVVGPRRASLCHAVAGGRSEHLFCSYH